MSVFIIADVAQTHDGSLGLAHAFIDSVAKTGANAIKFQTHLAQAESTPEETFRVPFSNQDNSRFDYWKRMEWSFEQWLKLKEHAEERNLIFLSSPFSIEAFELLEKLNVSAWKVGSGEVRSRYLLESMLRTKKPLFISTGMSTFLELDELVSLLEGEEAHFTLMQCTTEYPCPPQKTGLNVLTKYKARYDCPVGLSDHSGSIFPSLAAVSLGASTIEVHIALTREMYGPDVSSSVTPSELTDLVRGVRMIEIMLSHPVDKDALSEEHRGLKKLFGKAAVSERDIPVGTPLAETDVRFKKPANGILEWEFKNFIGKNTRNPIRQGQFIRHEDLDI